MARIEVAVFADTDVDDFLSLSLSEYGPSTSTTHRDHVRWKHLTSPAGASFRVGLFEAGTIVGRALLQPRKLLTASKALRAANVSDVLIARAHRTSPANFLELTKATGNIPAFDVVYHTSNERTGPLYRKLLRFPLPFSLGAYGLPLRIAGFIAKFTDRRPDVLEFLAAPWRWAWIACAVLFKTLARLDVSTRPIADAELAALSARCLAESGPLLERSNAFLKWRFVEAPLWPADIYRVESAANFIGYAVTRRVELDDLVFYVLMDFLLSPDAPLKVRLALRLWLAREAIAAKADALYTMANSSCGMARKWIGFPFARIPDKLLPHSTPIFMRVQGNNGLELATDRTVHFTLADLDYF